MPAITVRNIPEETHRALKRRAAAKGRSTEAEVRVILEEAVHPPERIRIGSELAALGRKFGGVELNIERDKTPVRAADFD
jgi:plasmid stability protein